MGARTVITGVVCVLLCACLVTTAPAEDMKASVKVTGGGTYDYVVVGGVTGAEEGLDYLYDIIYPSPNLNDSFIATSIPHPEWGAVKDEFRADMRPAETDQSWTMAVSSNLPAGTPLKLDLDGETSVVPEGYTLSVTDVETGDVVSLDGATPYEFVVPAGGIPKELRIDASYVAPVVEETPLTEEESPAEEQAAEEAQQADDSSPTPAAPDAQEGSTQDTYITSPGGSFQLSMAGNSSSSAERPGRHVARARAVRARTARRNINMAKKPSPGAARGKAVPSSNKASRRPAKQASSQQNNEPISCKQFIDTSGETVIYCGLTMSDEEILRRAFKGKKPDREGMLASADYGRRDGLAMGRLINGMGLGLDIGSAVSDGELVPAASRRLLMPSIFERLKTSFVYHIDVRAMERFGKPLNNY
jgi:hypothetical protein